MDSYISWLPNDSRSSTLDLTRILHTFNKDLKNIGGQQIMNHKFRTSFLSMTLLSSLLITSFASPIPTFARSQDKEVQVLFTHDMHSHLDPYKINKDGSIELVGGFAKLKTTVDAKKQEKEATFLVDGGDFSMGTLYQTIYETEAPELTLMGQIGYDATTFGNHEFDYRSEGLSNMLHSAKRKAEKNPDLKLPALVSANIDWDKNTSKDNFLVRSAMEDYGSTPYTIVERGGVRVGMFGVLGEDADSCAPESGLEFEDIVETSKEVVKDMKEEDVDMIICLSHSGTFEDADNSEDEILAQEVPEIDIIVSGHTHTRLDKPIQYGNTYIVSAGCYCENLGDIDLIQKEDGRWQLDTYELTPLTAQVKENQAITTQLASYKETINQDYLSHFGYTFDQVIAQNAVDFSQMDSFAMEHKEDPLGSIIADSYIHAVQQAEGDAYEKAHVALTPSGVIRDTFQTGNITVSDAFNVSSLGIGADRIPGYPLVSVYLTGKELKTIAEIDVSVSKIMPTAQLYPSGLRWTYNPNRMFLNRVTNVEFMTNVPYTNGKETEKIEDNKLYRVIAGLYSAQMLGTVQDMSMGLLKIQPKDKEGNPIQDFEKVIIHDQKGTEVKEWYALASYIDSMKENEAGISQVSSHYNDTENRKEEINSKNPIELLKNPNKFAWMLYGAIVIIILLIVFIVRWFLKRRKNK